MDELKNILETSDKFEKRSALYYLTRYVKQAKIFHNYKKNIFIDGIESNPSEKVKIVTLKMIEFIEESANKKAVDFSHEEFLYWMDLIAELEDSIDTEPSEDQIQKALNAIQKFETPSKTNNNGR